MEFTLQGSLNITDTHHILLLHLFLKRIEEGLSNRVTVNGKYEIRALKKKVGVGGKLGAKFVFELPGSQREEGIRMVISALLLEVTLSVTLA